MHFYVFLPITGTSLAHCDMISVSVCTNVVAHRTSLTSHDEEHHTATLHHVLNTHVLNLTL